jgi:uncharacterized spore protein YtfJ
MALSDVINTALQRIEHIAKTETVFGNPVTVGDMTLIPVSKVSVGFAAGGAGKDDKSGSGAGTGGGVNVTPVAFISISGDKVKVHNLESGELIDPWKLWELAPEAFRRLLKVIKKKDSNKNEASGEDGVEIDIDAETGGTDGKNDN